jgi:putative SOS response-associated peptidase YedK
MCANYLPPTSERIRRTFGAKVPAQEFKQETYPGYLAPIIRLSEDETHEKESVAACFGMVPPWAELKLSRQTYNARSETVAEKPSFRSAWRKGQFCIIPADAIFEPRYASGQASRWKITTVDERPLGIAGIWEWRPNGGPEDRPLVSFSMLTINADDHPLLRQFHKPEDEKRMVVILEPQQYDLWLQADATTAASFLKPYPAEALKAAAAPRPVARKPAVRKKPESLPEGRHGGTASLF